MSDKKEIIEIKHLGKTFGKNEVLKDINFSINEGDVTCIIGASGSGKSTLLNIVGGIDNSTSGGVIFSSKKKHTKR